MNHRIAHHATKLSLGTFGFIFVCVFSIWTVHAEDYTSPNFLLRDPVITVGGTRLSSPSFELFTSAGQAVSGESASTSFIGRTGFLYFPTATSPVVSASAGDSQVSLSWTASVGALGSTVSSYTVGQSTTSGGPYTFTNVGNVTSATKTGLSNGTTYYFVVQARDAAEQSLIQSAQVSATPQAPAPAPSAGGGGGGVSSPQTKVDFSGRAYPGSTVVLLKDAQLAVKTVAGPDAKFQMSLSGLSGGSYIFSVYTEDQSGIRSPLLNFQITVITGADTTVSGIFLAPTIGVDKSEVKRGENIAIFGQSIPLAVITIVVNSDEEFFNKVNADGNGVYLYNFDTSPLAIEQHLTKSKAAYQGEVSPFGQAVTFKVGAKTVFAEPQRKCPSKADVNSDCSVNLIDYSITAYWYKRALSVNFATIERERFNGDGRIDLVDFGIMAYYWTG